MEVEREIEKAGSSWSHVSLACQEDGCTWNVPFPKLACGMCIKCQRVRRMQCSSPHSFQISFYIF